LSGRIVFTVATGKPKYAEQALGLGRSLKLLGDKTPRVVMSDLDHPGFARVFDAVVRPTPGVPTYLLKLEALTTTNADEVMFVDSDSIAFKRVDAGFAAAEGADFAVQGRWIREGHWYGWLHETLPKLQLDALPMFNGGMMIYRRTNAARQLIRTAAEIAANYDATGLERFRGTVPDEPCVAVAMARTGIGRLLPDTVDLMNTPVGLVGPLQMDVMRGRCRFLKHGHHGLRLIEPTILHAGKYVNNAAYWRQLDRLAWLERYEDRHSFGYMGPWHKLRRSIERRILRAQGRL